MPNFSPLGQLPPSKKILAEVEKIRRAIKQGSLDKRENLVEKLGELALSLAAETQFAKVLEVWDEIIELTETLQGEGKLEITKTMLNAVHPISSIVRMAAIENGKRPTFAIEEALFQKHKKCIEMLHEEEFLSIKNEWALTIHERAELLHENGATIAAIALLDESLQMMEPLVDTESPFFTERKPFLDIYRSRGQWKCDIGDQESGIADLLRFEELAKQASDLLNRKIATERHKNRNAGKDGNFTLRVDSEFLLDHYASFSFQEGRFEAILYLATVFHGRAEKEKALEYYDKALAIVNENKDVHERAGLQFFAAPMDVPYRKGSLLAQYHQHEDALEQFDLAVENAKTLLQINAEDDEQGKRLEKLKDYVADITRARAETLQKLGRFEEAKDAVNLTQSIYAHSVKAGKENPLSGKNIFSNKKSGQPSKPLFAPGEEFDEKEVLKQFGVMHNEAMMDVQRANIETMAGNWRRALRFLLKARFVVDSPVIITLPGAKKNVFQIYLGVARLYAILKEYEKSQIWYERAIKHAQSFIDEGDYDFKNKQCDAYEGLGELYSEMGRHEDSLVEYTKVFNQRVTLIEEQDVVLEGMDREHLRIHDNQKLMPLAVLLQAQIKTIQSIEMQIFIMHSPESAESWAKLEMEAFGNLRKLLLNPEDADGDFITTAASCSAMLLWGNANEGSHESLKQWIADQRSYSSETADAPGNYTDYYINVALVSRLRTLYAKTDFQVGARIYQRLSEFVAEHKYQEAYKIAPIFRSLLAHELEQLQDPPLAKRLFYEKSIELLDTAYQQGIKEGLIDLDEHAFRNHPYNPDEIRNLFETIEREEAAENENREDIPDEDENASLYEEDYESANDNTAMFYKMLDAFTGNNSADELIERDRRSKKKGIIPSGVAANTGRNDPCPCGSGKKYKVCCLKR